MRWPPALSPRRSGPARRLSGRVLGGCLGLLSASGHDPAPGLHPVDGPDVDVRIQVQSAAVKVQIIMNLAYVDEIIDTPREDEFKIQTREHDPIRRALFAFYKKSNRIAVDGIPVAPLDRGFEVDPGDPDMLPLFPLNMEKALIRVQMSLEYPCKAAPSRVSITWGEFPLNPSLAAPGVEPRIEIKPHLIARGIDQVVSLTKAEPEYTWHDTGESVANRFLTVPEPPQPDQLRVSVVAGGLGLVGLLGVLFVLGSGLTSGGRARFGPRARRTAILLLVLLPAAFLTRNLAVVEVRDPFDPTPPLPTVAEAEAIFTPLHRNIYRAFDYVEESEIYDALARSVDGPLLDDLYRQVYRSLIMHEEGGAVSRVQAVRPVATVVETRGTLPTHGDRPGFQVHARWQVDGVVRHWNHAHYRTNEYEARYTVVRSDRGWRIAENEVLGQKRIDDGSDVPPAETPADPVRGTPVEAAGRGK